MKDDYRRTGDQLKRREEKMDGEETGEYRLIVGARFPSDDKIRHYSTCFELKKKEWCLVETEKGRDIAQVIEILDGDGSGEKDYPKVIRRLTSQDWRRVEKNKRHEARAKFLCQKKIRERDLPMKLVAVHYAFDGSKVTFYFTAEGRVDFRELVKDLAYIFKTRIEMRQIGHRDETRIFGGYGFCGRVLCCHAYIERFNSVSIKMAKAQNLILTPNKISGICGKLLCCLAYEHEVYTDFARIAPKEGTWVQMDRGKGKVVAQNPLKKQVVLRFEGGEEVSYPLSEVKDRVITT